jgi:hypothetical protein
MSIFVDTNVLLDVLLCRDNFFPDSQAVFDIVRENDIGAFESFGIPCLSPSEYITQFHKYK